MIIVKYQTESEAEAIITEKTAAGYVLTNVDNVTEGNFLGFVEADKAPSSEPTLSEIKEQNLVIMDALATLFETMIGGTV